MFNKKLKEENKRLRETIEYLRYFKQPDGGVYEENYRSWDLHELVFNETNMELAILKLRICQSPYLNIFNITFEQLQTIRTAINFFNRFKDELQEIRTILQESKNR